MTGFVLHLAIFCPTTTVLEGGTLYIPGGVSIIKMIITRGKFYMGVHITCHAGLFQTVSGLPEQ